MSQPKRKQSKSKESAGRNATTGEKAKTWKELDERFRSLLMDEPESSILGVVMEMLNVGERVTMWHISLRHDYEREDAGKPWMDFLTKEGFEMPEAVPKSNDFTSNDVFADFFRRALPTAISAGLVCSTIAMAWALGQGLLPTKKTARIAAAAVGKVDIVAHLCSEENGRTLAYTVQAAAFFDQLGVLRFLEGHGFPNSGGVQLLPPPLYLQQPIINWCTSGR